MANAVGDEADVEIAGQDPFDLPGSWRFEQPGMDIWHRCAEPDENFREQLVKRRPDEADAHLGRVRRCGLRHLPGDVRLEQGTLRLDQEDLARLAQFDIAFGTVEQIDAKAQLQPADRLAERRLRHVEPHCGASEVEFFGHRDELAHLAQVQGSWVPFLPVPEPRSGEMQAAILALEIEQGIAVRLEPGVEHFADEHQVVAAFVAGVSAAIETRQRSGQDRRTLG